MSSFYFLLLQVQKFTIFLTKNLKLWQQKKQQKKQLQKKQQQRNQLQRNQLQKKVRSSTELKSSYLIPHLVMLFNQMRFFIFTNFLFGFYFQNIPIHCSFNLKGNPYYSFNFLVHLFCIFKLFLVAIIKRLHFKNEIFRKYRISFYSIN